MEDEEKVAAVESSINKNTQSAIVPSEKDAKESKVGSESSCLEESDDSTDWTEEDDDDENGSNHSQNIDDDFVGFSLSGKRHCGDGEEEPLMTEEKQGNDDDEDKKNPAYVPRRGSFFEHDLRKADEIDVVEGEDGSVKSSLATSELGVKWVHDRFDEKYQRPKSVQELVTLYGFNIRKHEKCRGPIVRPVFKHRYKGPCHGERMNGRKKGTSMAKKNAFRTFIVVRNNSDESESFEENKTKVYQTPVKKIVTKDVKKVNEDIDEKNNKQNNLKKSPSPVNDKAKAGILKNAKKSIDENDKILNTSKNNHKSYQSKPFNKPIPFSKSHDNDLITKKPNNDKKWGTFNRNESYIDSFYHRSKPAEEPFKSLDESFKYNINNEFDFPSFSGEIFIGRPIYSIRGNFKKKKNLVGSGRIAPVIGSKASSTSYNKSSDSGGTPYDSRNLNLASNMVYTNSNMNEHFNMKYKPDYTNKVFIEVNNNTNTYNPESGICSDDVGVNQMDDPHSNNYPERYNKTWGHEGGYRNYNQQHKHSYMGWGRHRGGRMQGGRGWIRNDSRYTPETQDVRLIVMCGGNDDVESNDESQASLKGENEEVIKINSNAVTIKNVDNGFGNNENRRSNIGNNGNRKNNIGNKNEFRRFKEDCVKEDILPPVTCCVISRSRKTTPVYSVASGKNDIEANNEFSKQLSNDNVRNSAVVSSSLELKSLSEASDDLKRLSLNKNEMNKNNQFNSNRNKQSMYPRLPVLPKNRLFHPNNFNNSPAYVSTAFIIPSGPMVPSKSCHDKNALMSHQLIALPVRVTPMPFLLAPQHHLQQPRMQPPHRMQQMRNKNTLQWQNQYQNQQFFTYNNFPSNFPSNFSQNKLNDPRMKLPPPRSLTKLPFGNSAPVSKPNSLPLFSSITVSTLSTLSSTASLSTSSSSVTSTITTPSDSSLAISNTTSHTTSSTHTYLAQSLSIATEILNTNFKLSPHAATFKSTQFNGNQSFYPSFKSRAQSPFFNKSSKKQSYKLNSTDTVYELTPLKFQHKCPIEVRGGTVYFSPEVQPKRCSSASKKPSLNKLTLVTAAISSGVLTEKQSEARTKKALPIIDPKNMKELDEARKADGCEAAETSGTSSNSGGDNGSSASNNDSRCDSGGCDNVRETIVRNTVVSNNETDKDMVDDKILNTEDGVKDEKKDAVKLKDISSEKNILIKDEKKMDCVETNYKDEEVAINEDGRGVSLEGAVVDSNGEK